MARLLSREDLIASHYTLSGAGVLEPARFSFEERVAAAARAGFAGIGIEASSYVLARKNGLSDRDMQAVLREHDIVVGEIEFLYDWAHGGTRGERARRLEDRLYEMADLFQPHHLNVGEMGPATELDELAAVAERFAGVCERAHAHGGLPVAIEFLPWTGIPDAGVAWEIARRAGYDNGGVLVDAWHYYRGAADASQIRAIPGTRIHAVQLDDADATPVGELVEDTIERRRLPGAGAFDLTGLIRLLDEIGVAAPLSVEILSTEHRALPVDAAARAAYDSTRAAVTAARA